MKNIFLYKTFINSFWMKIGFIYEAADLGSVASFCFTTT